MTIPRDAFLAAAKRFAIPSEITHYELLERGHIHDTAILTARDDGGEESRYLFQRVNDRVFTDVPGLMHNIGTVTRHLRRDSWRAVGELETLNLVLTKSGRAYAREGGDSFRCYDFVAGTRTFDRCTGPEQAYDAAFAFGNFQARLLDLDARSLEETIPDFFSATSRLRQFDNALWADPASRAVSCAQDIAFVEERRRDADVMDRGLEQGRLPLRVIHGDTKLNNILFDKATGKARCIVDLDTCMAGWSLYDFGDLVRFTAATSDEDERDLTKAGIDMTLYSGLAAGWLDSTRAFMTDDEVELMPFAARLVTWTVGLRFLTDHLAGDQYFKVHYPGHNLDRARVQFAMVEAMEAQFSEMSAAART